MGTGAEDTTRVPISFLGRRTGLGRELRWLRRPALPEKFRFLVLTQSPHPARPDGCRQSLHISNVPALGLCPRCLSHVSGASGDMLAAGFDHILLLPPPYSEAILEAFDEAAKAGVSCSHLLAFQAGWALLSPLLPSPIARPHSALGEELLRLRAELRPGCRYRTEADALSMT